MGTPENIIEQLRRAMNEADVSRYRIAKDTGMDQGNLSRFIHGEAAMSLPAFATLCEYFGLRLEPTGKPKRKPAAKRKDK